MRLLICRIAPYVDDPIGFTLIRPWLSLLDRASVFGSARAPLLVRPHLLRLTPSNFMAF